MEEVFGPGGLIARYHTNYEYRPGQIEMAEVVDDTLGAGGITLIEAGTGTGKTLAYLIPALAAGRRVVVSTATKNLQEQLYKKDIPFLQKVVPRPFTAVCMKGRSNYVCLYRLKKAEHAPILRGLDEADHFGEVRKWAAETATGDRAELTDLPEDLPFWPQIDARAEICLGQKCPDYDACFITRMRQQALDADVIIVNHHLFFADLALRGDDYGSVLPDYSTVIFDEAHELEDVAASYFGASASSFRVAELIHDAEKIEITNPAVAGEVTRALARLSQRADAFFNLLGRMLGLPFSDRNNSEAGRTQKARAEMARGTNEGRFVLKSSQFAMKGRDGNLMPTALGETYVALSNSLERVKSVLELTNDESLEKERTIRRIAALRFDLDFIVSGADPTFVYWGERRGRGIFLQATPINVSGILAEQLFSNLHSSVLTSATLTTGGSFEFIKSRLGIGNARGMVVDSHFDFKRQAVLYLPSQMPDPRSREFLEASVDEIVRILETSRGRAFVLFTSVSSMRETYERVRCRIPFPAFIQGQGSKSGLLELFRNTEGAVLFATSSFWQGVDVQGDALSCVIISKLPFAVPTDPVVSARQNYIDANGGNSFYEYSVPGAVISLKQGLGRLIRSTTDRGVLSILDPRLRTKSYGRVFLDSLPPVRITSNLSQAAQVFDE